MKLKFAGARKYLQITNFLFLLIVLVFLQSFFFCRISWINLERCLWLLENIIKNRYKDILPHHQSQLELPLLITDSDSDYINASLIKGATEDRKYITCQRPHSSTVTDLWRMIWLYNAKVIVVACRELEQKWRVCLGCSSSQTHPNDDMVAKTLTVTNKQASRLQHSL